MFKATTWVGGQKHMYFEHTHVNFVESIMSETIKSNSSEVAKNEFNKRNSNSFCAQ